MTDRLTVVFDDPELYRRLKVRAAEEGIPMKQLIQSAVAAYLEETAPQPAPAARQLDWQRWDAFQQELDALPEDPAPDASDVKHQLYGTPRRRLGREGWATMAAEERATYDAGEPDEDSGDRSE